MKKLRPPTLAIANLILQAMALHRDGESARAEALYRTVLDLDPKSFDALNMLGVLVADKGDPLGGLALIEKALKINPASARVHLNLGPVLRQLGRDDDALKSYQRSIALQPNMPEAHYNLGNLFDDMGKREMAVSAYDRAIRLRPDYYDAQFNRGVSLADAERFEEAFEAFTRAEHLQPNNANPYYGQGVALSAMLRIEEAAERYACAITLNADHNEAQWNASHMRLLLGDFKSGWGQYEARRAQGVVRSFAEPLWLGDESLAGKTILLHAEQGLGDTIQFCRYASDVAALGAKVILEVQPALVSLTQSSLAGDIEVIAKGDAFPEFDYQCPILSLPFAFKTELETIPSQHPYLFADDAKVDQWRLLLGEKRKSLRVGLVWSGNQGFVGDKKRSVPFRDILAIDDGVVEFVCLHKEVRTEDRDALLARTDIRFFGDQLHDFSDTAALVANMDLVVTTDTSIAHLAGALGKPTWILTPQIPDWRWMLVREDCPWYPSVRLFRQSLRESDWPGVYARIRQSLHDLAKSAI